MKQFAAFIAIAWLAACAQLPASAPDSKPADAVTVERVEGDYCQTEVFKVDADFSSANMHSCAIIDARTVEVFLKPEDVPINLSPWYAVRLTPMLDGDVRIVLRYEEHPHRYKPKVSEDGRAWSVVPDDRVGVKAAGYRVTIKLSLDDTPLFLSAQELFTNAAHAAWIEAMISPSR